MDFREFHTVATLGGRVQLGLANPQYQSPSKTDAQPHIPNHNRAHEEQAGRGLPRQGNVAPDEGTYTPHWQPYLN